MILTFSLLPMLQTQSARIKAQIAKIDLELTARYGDRYDRFKQQLNTTRDWYDRTKAESQASGTIPLEQRQAQADRQVADAGSRAAQKEAAIVQQLKDLWYSIRNNR